MPQFDSHRRRCNGTASAVNVASGEDFFAEYCSLDFFNKQLFLPSGVFGLVLSNSQLKRAAVISTIDNYLNMTFSDIENCSFLSITNNGLFSLGSWLQLVGLYLQWLVDYLQRPEAGFLGVSCSLGIDQNRKCFISGDWLDYGSSSVYSDWLFG